MDEQLLGELLYEDESPTLDFKQEQYRFEGGDAEQKGELLKDILAFANAWRRSDAFILIGVIEIKGGRSQVCGIDKHLDEASLQQFINEKTNRPIEFSYQALEYEGKQIGIVQIPLQERPLYLLKRYGKLENEKVYLRRGSSTAIAKPDEIAKMGAILIPRNSIPTVELNFANPTLHVLLGKTVELRSKLLLLPDKSEIPAIGGGSLTQINLNTNSQYYREFADYLFSIELLQEVGFVLENTSEILIKNPTLKFTQSKIENLGFLDVADYPTPPSYSRTPSVNLAGRNLLSKEPTTTVYDRESYWEIVVEFGDIQPKAQVWSEKFYIGTGKEHSLEIDMKVFADNLPEPIEESLEISLSAERTEITIEEIISRAEEHRD